MSRESSCWKGVNACGARAWLLRVVAPVIVIAPIAAQDVGFEGPGFPASVLTPTESKPQSKLWYHDGFWWGYIWSSAGAAYRIHRLNFLNHTWFDTGVAVDSRANSHGDVLWDGTKLYIVSHRFSTTGSASGNPIRFYRFSYNAGADTYSLDAGFPVAIGDFSTESVVIDKDSTGTVWAAWTQARRVRIAHTTGSDTSWSTSIILPTNTSSLNVDDICSLIHYSGNRIGVLWSDQAVNRYRFSFHVDGAADTAWSPVENVTTNESDDHLSLAADGAGRVYLAGKSAANNVLLLVRGSAGGWSRFLVADPTPILTRPIVLLDEQSRTIHVFATAQDTGEVFEKTSSMDEISFGTSVGTMRMRDASAVFRISDPTSTKQSITETSGLVVLAHHDTTGSYWHHSVTPPPVAAFGGAPTTGVAPLTVNFTDSSIGPITSRLWTFGDGSTSSATNPSKVYAPGTYTVSLTATGPGGSDIETKTNFIVVAHPPPVANFGAAPTSGFAPLTVGFTDASTGGPITTRLWSFGDGGTSSATSPSHAYAAGTYTVSLTTTGPGGSDTETKANFIVVVHPPPVANFTAAPTSGIAPLNVAFTDTSTGPITTRLWSFGDGSTSSATNPTHVYTVGTYTVSLATTGPGGSDTETKASFIVVVHPPPVANFGATPTSGTAPLTVAFTDASTGPITSRLWSFGDGTTSSAPSPGHVYSAGTYTVSLTTTGPGGSDSETKANYIVVTSPPPVANFSGTPTTGTAPLTVAFTDASTGPITSRLWSFGDGTTSSATSPGHVYSAGTYTVSLTTTGPGGSDTETKADYVVVTSPPPVANFSGTPTAGTAPLTVAFTDTSTGPITSRLWSFGDGTTSSATSPSHVYSAGTYTVSLTTSGPGGSDTETKANYIVVTVTGPAANFTAAPTSGTAPLTVGFTDTSSGSITSRLWNFGDGGTSSATNPSHVYAAGTYTVTLTVDGPGGSDAETKTNYIVVTSSTPVANFTAAPTSGTAPLTVGFTDASSGSITSRLWNFGDGSTSSAASPSHVYATGTYTVTLTVNGPGGSDSETKPNLITVSGPTGIPVASFTASSTGGAPPLTVAFTDTSTGSISTRLWSFGDGSTSSVTSPSHVYSAGTFTVALTVTGPGGSDTETKVNLVTVGLMGTVETTPVASTGDAADDVAVWIHPTDRSLSTVLGTDKLSGLAVYDLAGNRLQFLPDGQLNNVDLRYDFPLGGDDVALVTCGERSTNRIAIYAVDPATRLLRNVAARVINPGIAVKGSCMYRSKVTGDTYFFGTAENGAVEQWRLFDNGAGRVDASRVRTFSLGSQGEGCVADDEAGFFFISEEATGIWRFGAEPGAGNTPVLVDATGGGHLTEDVEGLSIYYASGGAGYLLAASQGDSTFAVYDRRPPHAYKFNFRIGANPSLGIDDVTGTDGIEAVNLGLGSAFPSGVFVVQDNINPGANQNFKLVPWPSVAHATSPPLLVDTTYDPYGNGCPSASATPRNGSGVNPFVLVNRQEPRLGSVWAADLDCSGHAPSTALLLVYSGAASGSLSTFGELLVNVASPHLVTMTALHTGNTVRFSHPLPNNLALCGRRIYVQGLCRGLPLGRLSNALDLVLGD